MWTALGIAVVLATLLDVFFTVLHPDGVGFVSGRLFRAIWALTHAVARPLPHRGRRFVLALGAPLMIPAAIGMWVAFVSLGFAFIYYDGFRGDNFTFIGDRLDGSFVDALYLSGASLSTLGFGDVTPHSSAYQLLTVAEALIGFGILTLTISYVLAIFQFLHQLAVLTSDLHHQAGDSSDPESILAPHFVDGRPEQLGPTLAGLHRGLVSHYEGMRRYPIVYYFHSRRAYRSMPYAFRMAAGLAASLRWALPAGHPGTREPWLPTLLTGIDTVTHRIEDRFLPRRRERAPDPVDPEQFATDRVAGRSDDTWVARFLAAERQMLEAAELEPPPSGEAYARYRDWLPFAFRTTRFVELAADDLGYDREELTRSPGEPLF